MRAVIVVETQQEFDAWMAGKKPQYEIANAGMAAPAKTDSTTGAVTPAPAATSAQMKMRH
jgi:cytochrome c oxidase subunit 2